MHGRASASFFDRRCVILRSGNGISRIFPLEYGTLRRALLLGHLPDQPCPAPIPHPFVRPAERSADHGNGACGRLRIQSLVKACGLGLSADALSALGTDLPSLFLPMVSTRHSRQPALPLDPPQGLPGT